MLAHQLRYLWQSDLARLAQIEGFAKIQALMATIETEGEIGANTVLPYIDKEG